MSYYPSQISERFYFPKNTGKCAFPNAMGTNASFTCGAVLRFTLEISERRIVDAKFKATGCGYLIASADFIAEEVIGKELGELHGLADLRAKAAVDLGRFPEDRKHCLDLAFDSIQAAFNDYRSAQLEEFAGEKALICTCFGVTEERIESIIETFHCESVEEVSARCNAGSGCGSCQPLIREIIDTYANML